MVTSINVHPAAWMDGIAVAGQDLRLQVASAMLTGAAPYGTTGIAARPGVRYATGNPLLVQASSGMNVTVNAGVAFVQGTASATSGMYTGCLDTTGTLTVPTSDPTNPRIDNINMQFVDNGNGTSTATVNIQTGTPAPSPVAPTPPANSQTLATIAVGAGVSSIVAANITDKRFYTSALGGITPFGNVTSGIAGPAGNYAHDLSSGRLRVSDGAGNAVQPKTSLFAPVSNGPTSWNIASPNYSLVTSLSVTVDGNTEIEAIATFLDITTASGAATSDSIALAFGLNGTTWPSGSQSMFIQIPALTGSGSAGASGSSIRAWITPSAGTATINFYAWSGTSAPYRINNLYFRVQANPAQ